MKLRALLLAGVVGLGGCATYAGYQRVLNSWVGDTSDNLIMKWGPPANQTELSDHSRVFEYGFISQGYVPPYTTPTRTRYDVIGNEVYGTTTGGQQIGGFTTTSSCQTLFYVSSEGKITGWRYNGNGCLAQ